jgi:phosphate-selective porin OprO/OprP
VVVSGLRVVAEGHAVAYVGPVRLTVEGAVARESRSKDADGNPATPRVDLDAISSYGLTTEVAWVLLGSPREVGRAPRARGSADGGWSGGAVELAARYDGMWLARRARDVRVGGSQGGALALKWWPVDFMAATLAGDVTRYEAAPLEEPDTLISWGFQARASFFWGAPSEPQRPPLRER